MNSHHYQFLNTQLINQYYYIIIIIDIHMKIVILTLLIGVLLAAPPKCNASNYEFLSNYSLGLQNQLNVTFAKIQQALPPIPSVTYSPSDRYKYLIKNFKPVFFYLDSSQRGEVIGNDTILVTGGKLRIDFTFDWNVTGLFNKTGTASGWGISDPLVFGKELIVNSQGFPMFTLAENFPLTMTSNLNITRIDPFSQDDFDVLTSMLNKLENVTTIRDLILNGSNTLLPINLNDSLHDEQFKLQRYRNYTWTDAYGANLTITFQHFLMNCDLERAGLNLLFAQDIKDYDGFICGKDVPMAPLDPQYYGGTQQFVSLGVYFSSVQYALEQGLFHTNLNQDNWESDYFQFYVGDLYDAIPVLTGRMLASEKLTGNCVAGKTLFNLTRGGIDFFNVTIYFSCNLGTQKTKIVDFNLKAIFQVQGVPSAKSIDFFVKDAILTPTFNTYQDFKVENLPYANYLVQSCVQSLIGMKVFGSGYGAFTRDYPHFEVRQDYTVIYDSSHVPGMQYS